MLASLLLHNPNCHARCRRGGGQAGPPTASAAGATAIGDMTRMPRRLPPLGLRHAGEEGNRASANKWQMAVRNHDGFGGHIQISIQLRCNAEKRFCLIENSPGAAN